MDKTMNSIVDYMDHYDITLDKVARIMNDRVFCDSKNKTVPLDELRKYIDMCLRLRNQYPKEQKSIESNVTFSWEGEE